MQAAKVIPSSQEDTPFGKVCDSLPDNMEGLDAVIEDLAEDLANTVDNEKVVQKFDKVRLMAPSQSFCQQATSDAGATILFAWC